MSANTVSQIHKVELSAELIQEDKKQNTNIKMNAKKLSAEINEQNRLFALCENNVEMYNRISGSVNDELIGEEDDIIADTWDEFAYKKSQKGTYTRATLIEYAKSVGIKVLVRDNQTKIVEKIITLRIGALHQNKMKIIEERILKEIAETHKIEPSAELIQEDKNITMNTEMNTQLNTEMTAPKYYMNSGSMDRHFFDEYLAENASKVMLQKINEYWTDEEDFLEYKVFGLENPSDRKGLEYSECWMLDYTDGYLPIVVCGVNTSSCYSMCRCGMDRELDDDEEPERLTLDEISELMSGK